MRLTETDLDRHIAYKLGALPAPVCPPCHSACCQGRTCNAAPQPAEAATEIGAHGSRAQDRPRDHMRILTLCAILCILIIAELAIIGGNIWGAP